MRALLNNKNYKLKSSHPLYNKIRQSSIYHQGFTIVELLIVIIVLGVLAAVVIISYNGITNQSRISTAKYQLKQLSTKAETYKVEHAGTYPNTLLDIGMTNSDATYSGGGTSYCASMTANGTSYYISNAQTTPSVGNCTAPIANGSFIQDITSSNCPDTKVRAVDARDDHTYWVQKLDDGNCWMLTNLAYGGGGTNTYNDTIPTGDGTNGTLSLGGTQGGTIDASTYYDHAKYYILTNANVTSGTTNPSTSTDGGITNPQYGYLYNWCGAMGGQATAACANTTTPTPYTNISVCPAGWRLPTSGVGGEFTTLNTAINSGSTTSPSGLFTDAYSQYSGYWNASFGYQESGGFLWSSTQYSSGSSAYLFSFHSSSVYIATNSHKSYGFAVRCVVT